MVIAHHIILTGYGHWLPNDPRGSMSRELRADKLRPLGDIHHGRRESQPGPGRIRAFRQEAAPRLDHPLLWFGRDERRLVGLAFGQLIRAEGLTCYACAVLRNHAHLLIRRHRMAAQEMMIRLRRAGWEALAAAERLPPEHPVWSEDSCAIYKDTPRAVRAAAAYIEGNYRKHRISPERWDFVVPYDGWPFHKRLRPAP